MVRLRYSLGPHTDHAVRVSMTTKFPPRHRAPDRTYLRDYQPPAYRIPQVDLQFDLEAEETHVCSRLSIERVTPDRGPLQLDGEA